jgi:hypothetical protein
MCVRRVEAAAADKVARRVHRDGWPVPQLCHAGDQSDLRLPLFRMRVSREGRFGTQGLVARYGRTTGMERTRRTQHSCFRITSIEWSLNATDLRGQVAVILMHKLDSHSRTHSRYAKVCA